MPHGLFSLFSSFGTKVAQWREMLSPPPEGTPGKEQKGRRGEMGGFSLLFSSLFLSFNFFLRGGCGGGYAMPRSAREKKKVKSCIIAGVEVLICVCSSFGKGKKEGSMGWNGMEIQNFAGAESGLCCGCDGMGL